MDTGTYNCRDYHIGPPFALATNTNSSNTANNTNPDPNPNLPNTTKTKTKTNTNNTTANTHGTAHPILPRHESWAELEQRSRSPASLKPKFPLLALPLELRQQILLYLLPHTQELGGSSSPIPSLEQHVRNFPAVQRRVKKGMELPPEKKEERKQDRNAPARPTPASIPTSIAWHRGLTSLFAVSRQLHDECADLVYGGRNTFHLGVTYSTISFKFRYLLPSGMAPQREFALLERLPKKYLRRIRRVLVSVECVDSYTGMVKWNVGGRGLVEGLRGQVGRLVRGLGCVGEERESSPPSSSSSHQARRDGFSRVTIRVSSGNAVAGSLKARFGEVQRISQDVEEILRPFGFWGGVRDARVVGAVGQGFARELEERMRGGGGDCCESKDREECCWCSGMAALTINDNKEKEKDVPLCVYGNDI